jgi:hypothetical protein
MHVGMGLDTMVMLDSRGGFGFHWFPLEYVIFDGMQIVVGIFDLLTILKRM